MHCLQILCSWLIFDKLTNCEIAEIDFALLPKPASKAINQSEFFQIRVNSGIHHTALDSAQLMKMHGKAASGDLINFSKVSITFPAGIENLITGNIFNPPFHMSSFIRWHYIGAQGCISCGILVSGIWAHGVSSEHMENMQMFSCSPT